MIIVRSLWCHVFNQSALQAEVTSQLLLIYHHPLLLRSWLIIGLLFEKEMFRSACSSIALTWLHDNRKDYEKGYKKFLGLVKKQEQLLRGTPSIQNITNQSAVFLHHAISYINSFYLCSPHWFVEVICRLHVCKNLLSTLLMKLFSYVLLTRYLY